MKMPKGTPWGEVWDAGDARGGLPRELDGRTDLVATSTPYWSKARYSDDADEFGAGPLSRFTEDQVHLAWSVDAALRPGGWYALNLGDTRSNTGGAGGDITKAGQRIYRPDHSHGVIGQQWLGVPWRCFHAIQERTNLQLAGHVIWSKGRPVRCDNSAYHLARNRRPGLAHEDIALFWKPGGPQTFNDQVLVDAGEIGSVWTIPPATERPPRAQRSDDVKPWPNELALRLVGLLSRPGDLVVDPCAGYGTTGRCADYLGRVGVNLDPYWSTVEWNPVAAIGRWRWAA